MTLWNYSAGTAAVLGAHPAIDARNVDVGSMCNGVRPAKSGNDIACWLLRFTLEHHHGPFIAKIALNCQS